MDNTTVLDTAPSNEVAFGASLESSASILTTEGLQSTSADAHNDNTQRTNAQQSRGVNQDIGNTENAPASTSGAQTPQDPDVIVPESPEEYGLSFNENVHVDNDLLNSFTTVAHELGLQKGQAQKLADVYARHTEQATLSAHKAQVRAMVQAKSTWENEIQSRQHFEQEVVDARRTLKEFGSPELNEIMDSSLLGSHPVFFDFMVKVGKALAEPEVRGRSHYGHQEKSLMDRLWPNMK